LNFPLSPSALIRGTHDAGKVRALQEIFGVRDIEVKADRVCSGSVDSTVACVTWVRHRPVELVPEHFLLTR
jgi:hypothetical protein